MTLASLVSTFTTTVVVTVTGMKTMPVLPDEVLRVL